MINCIVCGKETQNVRFCSNKCYGVSISKEKNGYRICACCGQEKQLGDFPRYGKKRYSYCLVCHRAKIVKISHTPHHRWMHGKNRARVKNLDWDISEEDFCKLITSPCHYCSGPLGFAGVGLDRKSNSEGYLKSNVVPCCKRCNVVKNDYFTYDEMILLSSTLKKIRINREQ